VGVVTASGGGMVPVALRAPFTIPPPATPQRIGFHLSGHGLSNGAKSCDKYGIRHIK